jgi:hypothetical protein
MVYHENILCISGKDLIITEENPHGLIPEGTYKSYQYRKKINVVRNGFNGQTALIEFESLPSKVKEMAIAKYGNPKEEAASKSFKDKIEIDHKAATYYSNYLLADGRYLPEQTQKEYTTNASVLNAIHTIKTDATVARKALGTSLTKFWSKALIAVNNVRVELGHTLPANEIALKRKYTKYQEESYEGIISGKFCNDNSRKVTADLERLIMSLYSMPNKPFSADVHTMYTLFLSGKIEVTCQKTGEIFNPKDFIKNGQPLVLGVTTVWNYINQPNNRVIVDKSRSGAHRFNSTHRPHHHRHAPEFSFSKISLDDRDLPRKCVNGKWLKAYYSYDVASGCVIGYAFSMEKNEELFLDCLRNMFRLIQQEGFGMPLEAEVEHHLVNKFFDDLAIIFPFLRICNPGNSQEKRAEHFNRAKKYGIEKKLQNGIGRWWAKGEAYTTDRDKVNDEFVEKAYTQDRLIADDIEAIKQYNNALHPKQKKYPGKTRWQVLIENMNPNAYQPNKAVVYKAVGEHTLTTITRNQYVTVRGCKYQIPNVSVLDKLLPNNYTVNAYYLPDADGVIDEVYLYQNGDHLCKAEKIGTYSEAKAEWTDKDKDSFTEQAKYVSQFDAHTKKGKNELSKLVIVESSIIKEAIEQPIQIIEEKEVHTETIQDILDDYNPDDYAKNALDNL